MRTAGACEADTTAPTNGAASALSQGPRCDPFKGTSRLRTGRRDGFETVSRRVIRRISRRDAGDTVGDDATETHHRDNEWMNPSAHSSRTSASSPGQGSPTSSSRRTAIVGISSLADFGDPAAADHIAHVYSSHDRLELARADQSPSRTGGQALDQIAAEAGHRAATQHHSAPTHAREAFAPSTPTIAARPTERHLEWGQRAPISNRHILTEPDTWTKDRRRRNDRAGLSIRLSLMRQPRRDIPSHQRWEPAVLGAVAATGETGHETAETASS